MTLSILKKYAEHFTLEWSDDISEWEEDIGPTQGGGAYLSDPFHSPPGLFMADDGTIYITYAENKTPRDMMMDIVSVKALTNAVKNNDPLHDPEGTSWAESN